MAEFKWPAPEQRTVLGKPHLRVDGPVKVQGRAKYTYDYNPQGLLFGKSVRCPYPHVKAVSIIQGPGKEIHWAGDEIVGVAAVDEPTAEDAVRAIKVEYQRLPHNV